MTHEAGCIGTCVAVGSRSSTDEKLVLYRQQAGLVAAKKQEVLAKFNKVKEALQAAETELHEKEKYLSSFRGSSKVRLFPCGFC